MECYVIIELPYQGNQYFHIQYFFMTRSAFETLDNLITSLFLDANPIRSMVQNPTFAGIPSCCYNGNLHERFGSQGLARWQPQRSVSFFLLLLLFKLCKSGIQIHSKMILDKPLFGRR